jgi:signal transduction histidine kinase/CheY-like chemotaxis protein
MTGYDAAELRERPLQDIQLPDVQEDDGTAAALGGQRARRQRFLTKDGRILQVAASLRELRDASGRPVGTIGVLQDLTEMLRLRDSERAQQQSATAGRTKNDFLARLAQELRAPLNAIVGFAQSLSGADTAAQAPEQQQRALAQIRQNGWQLLEMVNDLLDLSHIEAGQLRMKLEAVPLAELIQETTAACEGQAQQHEVSLRRVLSPAADWVQADATRLRQVLTHLIVNGIRYNHRGGQVELRTRWQDERVSIEVEDDGLGMSEAQLERLFTPFDRLGREHQVPQGTGIGLVVCKRLLALMQGELIVSSREHEGSTFTIRLPRASLGGGSTAPAPPIAAPVSIGRVLCIMAPGDDVEALRRLLLQRPGIELVHAGSAAAGVDQAREADLVLLDLALPDRPALELLKALKADPHTRRTPVLVVATQSQPAAIDACVEAGASDFLTRPFESATTLHAIDTGLASI